MKKLIRLGGFLAVVLAGLGALGCGASGGRQPIAGEITLGGRLLDSGTIEFDPLADNGVKSGAMIKDGRYEIPSQHGLTPGKYRVRITSGDPNVMELSPEEIGTPTDKNRLAKERVPPEYNVESKQIVEVTAEGPNKFDFAIP